MDEDEINEDELYEDEVKEWEANSMTRCIPAIIWDSGLEVQ